MTICLSEKIKLKIKETKISADLQSVLFALSVIRGVLLKKFPNATAPKAYDKGLVLPLLNVQRQDGTA